MSRLSGQGAMALLELDAAAAEEIDRRLPRRHGGGVSPGQTVVAGPRAQVDAVIASGGRPGRLARRSRSTWRPTIRPSIRSCPTCAARLPIWRRLSTVPLISTTGYTGGDADVRCRLLGGNVRQPVRFSQAVAAAGADYSQLRRDQPASAAHPRHHRKPGSPSGPEAIPRWVPTVNRDNPETPHLPHAPGHGAAAGGVGETRDRGAVRLVDVPPTPWLHSKYWFANRATGGSWPVLTRCSGYTSRCLRAATSVAGRRRNRSAPLAGGSQGARPTGHARRGFRRDRAGCR